MTTFGLVSRLSSCIVLILIFPNFANACEPCSQIFDIAESISRAQLVIVGQRADFTKDEQQRWARQDGPDTIVVSVMKTLKGKPASSQIRVNSWDGMCGYGLVVDDKPFLMILSYNQGIYDAVNNGCAIKALPYKDDTIELDGLQMPLQDFRGKYGF